MAPSSATYQGVSYALCTLSGIGILLNIMVAVVSLSHRQLRADSSLRYVRYSLLLTAVAHLATETGTLLVMLWPDFLSPVFCDAGAFLMLFGVTESLWLLLVCCATLLVQMKSRVISEVQGRVVTRTKLRWTFPIFLLSMLLKAVIMAMLVFLALTKTNLFKESAVTCQVVQLYGQLSWEYSTAVVLLGWAAAVPCVILSLCTIFVYGNKLKRAVVKYRTKERGFGRRLALVFLSAAVLWIIVLMVSTVVIFSGEKMSAHVNLALGFSYTLAICFSSAAVVVVLVLSRRWRHSGVLTLPEVGGMLKGRPPETLASLSKLPQVKDGSQKYHVQWLDRRRQLVSGVMKVYHPACLRNWRSEIQAVAKLRSAASASHPNVAEYLWQAHRNPFAPALCTFAGDILSPECSLVCMAHYPHGTLGGYLKTRSHMTEVGLHKVTLDVARGLGFIHQNHLVHNGLSTDTVYMSSVTGVGLRAVIGDFENSYEVSETTLRKSPLSISRPYTLDNCSFGSLYSISQQMDLDNNKFAPDIRSFGMVVLEMLIALGEFDEHSGMGVHYRTRRNSTYDNTSLVSVQSQPPARKQVTAAAAAAAACPPRPLEIRGSDSQLHHRHSAHCQCSPRVTDLRAARAGSSDGKAFVCSGSEQNLHDVKKSSAFSSLKSLQECNEKPHHRSASQRRLNEIQNRDLPPVPPRSRSKASPRKHRPTRPACDIIRPARAEVVSATPPPAVRPHADNNNPPPLSLDEFAPTAQTYDFSPSSDEFYSVSVGSLGSFETIYEDDEKNSPKANPPQTRNGHKGVNGKPPVCKRRTHDEVAQKKRFSVSSANDSVFSADSGMGSDTYSDGYSNRLWKDIHKYQRDLESPETSYYLKQSRSGAQRDPGHVCSSDPGFSTMGPTDSSASDTMSSEDHSSGGDHTYERIGSNKPPQKPSRPRSRVSDRNSLVLRRSAENLAASGPHPVIKQQYRFAVPRLGISAVLARRLSDASLSSVNSHKSTELSLSARDIRLSSTTNLSASKGSIPDDTKTRPDLLNTSISSSVVSMIQDSNSVLEKAESAPHKDQSSARTSKPRTSMTKSQMNQYNELAKLSKFLDCVSLDSRQKARMLNMIKIISRNDRMGFIGHQLMSLFSDCWLEDPVPSADEILNRLNLVLPSASV